MTYSFALTPGAETSEIRLVGPRGPVPVERWALEAPDALLPGVDLAQRLMASDSAVAVDDALLIGAAALAGLSANEGERLALPALAEAVARLTATGLIARPGYAVALAWVRPTGQPILGARRLGPWLEIGGQWLRLPDVLLAIAEAVERVNAAGERQEDRLFALADLHEALPNGAAVCETSGLVGAIHIAVATSFSLDLKNERLAPVLHGLKDDPDAPLLPEAQQSAFEQRFHAGATAPPSYALGGQWHVVPQPALRRALAVVKRVNGESAAARRAFFANPRPFLREALGDEVEETLFEGLLKETPAYASRVLGLGLWRPRVVPWAPMESQDWFGPGAPPAKPKGLMIGERLLPLTSAQAQRLHDEIVAARAAGEAQKIVAAPDGPLAIPADDRTLEALRAIGARLPPRPKPGPAEALLIETNENDVGAEEFVRRLRPGETTPPHGLRTALKSHQSEGLLWLQQAWIGGLPGVLLADDMGLGKTLQGLAFLAWLRQAMEARLVERAPLLVVAPTGLLRNWRAEHDKHLEAPGLGRCLEAYGPSLAALKRRRADGRPGLDVDALRDASWVLTTYETLRDFDLDFGQVRFAAALFDEAQKIKTPGVRMTDAAKAMHCEFRVALTGTPVENRLADLWCIVDGVHPGLLYDLKSFSAEYERVLDAAKLARLKATLERPFGGRVAVMKRRLKEDRLPDLPPAAERPLPRPMPAPQRAAYEAALNEARAAQAPGAVLAALQLLRAISLHPEPEADCGDETFIGQSARFIGAVESVDAIAQADEKVLIFLDDLALQARLASLLQRRYRLKAPPGIVSGEVAGARRQRLVDAFQTSEEGFGAMILSPRAGGVGLTLTRANHALHLSRWWNPAVEDQCTGRIHRIGQSRPVHIHLPLATLGDDRRSFDQNLDSLLARKRKLIRETLMPPDANAESDREELLRSTVA